MAVAVTRNGSSVDEREFGDVWRRRISQGKNAKRQREPTWRMNLAFAAGKYHLEIDERDSRSLKLRKLPAGTTRYSVDIITQYRQLLRADILGDDPRPQLLLVADDEAQEAYQEAVNRAIEHGWENEWLAEEVLDELIYTLIDLGTAAIQCEWDPTEGPVKGEVPLDNGQPVYDETQARGLVAGLAEQGATAQFEQIHEGRVRWNVLSPFELITPAAVHRSRNFPWEVVVRPVLLDKLKERFGDVAADMVADADVGVVSSDEGGGERVVMAGSDDGSNRLSDHAWLYSCFERPTREYPDGRVTYLGGKEMRPLEENDELPYKAPDGTRRSGITYFHFWPVTKRFWSRAPLEVMQDPQRAYNRRRAQQGDIIDRGLPKVFAEENTIKNVPRGLPLEIVQVKRGAQKPDYDGGVGPGQWMQADAEAILADLEMAVGQRRVSLGENPASVTNYSQLALLRETDKMKLDPIIEGFKLGLAHVIEDTVYDIRRYWGREKVVQIGGAENRLGTEIFNAADIPDFFKVRVVRGAGKPRTQAAELQKIEQIFREAYTSQQPLPIQWLKDSMDAGQPLELPSDPLDEQRDLALYENLRMERGEQPPVADYHDAMIHIPVHRSKQIEAEQSGDWDLWQREEAHCLEHQAVEEMKAAQAPAPPAAEEPPPEEPEQGGGQ